MTIQCVVVTAPAKVNLFLGVGAARPDGYHDVTTVLHALELADTVTLVPAAGLTVVCEPDPGVPMTANLAYKAALAFAEHTGAPAAAHIEVRKRIPHGAGLGGGSSDAAAVIAGLAHLAGLPPSDARCVAAARSVGADVPFFLEQSGAALMTERGDVVAAALPGCTWPVVVVRPDVPVPTAAAYRAFDADPRPAGTPDPVIAALAAGDPAELGAVLANNLESASAAVVPEVADALAWLHGRRGAIGAAVAGSGSAVFALCASQLDAEEIARAAAERGLWSAATALRAGGVEVRSEGL